MTQIKPDNILFTNLIDTYLNYKTYTAEVEISGTIPAFESALFLVNIPYDRANTRVDLYAENLNTGYKTLIIGNDYQEIYERTFDELVSTLVSYPSSSQITFSIFITNYGSGSPLTLVTQKWKITAVAYQVPF